MKEIWKNCHPSNKYEVSNIGRVRFIKNKKIINPHETDRGYLKSQFYLSGNKKETPFVHRLVLSAFCGKCPDGFQAGHLNGNKHDNRIENLKWITPMENTKHKFLHGVVAKGEKIWLSKLTEDQVKEIRRLYKKKGSGINSTEYLAKKFKITKANVLLIVTFQTWKHLKLEQALREYRGEK